MQTNVKIDDTVWNQLKPADQQKIQNIIDAYRLVPGNVNFVPTPHNPASKFPNPICNAACDVAQASAAAACLLISDGVLAAACLAAAQAAGAACHNNC